MNNDLKAAIDHLAIYDYCLLEDRIPANLAQSMVERFLELYADVKCQQYELRRNGRNKLP